MLTDDIMIPMEGKGLFGSTTYNLATYIHKPDDFNPTKRYPVVIISHGTAVDSYTRAHARFDFKCASSIFSTKGISFLSPCAEDTLDRTEHRLRTVSVHAIALITLQRPMRLPET